MKKFAFVFGITAILGGCAKNPGAIVPMTMPTGAYSEMDCTELAAEHQKIADQLHKVSIAQRKAATDDAVGVFLIGVPVSSVSGGDQAGAIAQLKGEIVSLEVEQRNKQCNPDPKTQLSTTFTSPQPEKQNPMAVNPPKHN
jgi:hypothetical protein